MRRAGLLPISHVIVLILRGLGSSFRHCDVALCTHSSMLLHGVALFLLLVVLLLLMLLSVLLRLRCRLLRLLVLVLHLLLGLRLLTLQIA